MRRLTGKLYVVCAVLVVVLPPDSWQCGSVSSAVGRIRQYSRVIIICDLLLSLRIYFLVGIEPSFACQFLSGLLLFSVIGRIIATRRLNAI